MGTSGTAARVCESCGRTSVLGWIDRWGRCPACRRVAPDLPFAGIASKVLLAAAVLGAEVGWVGKVLAILAIWPLELLNTVLHESAHALAAKALGWRVHYIAFGASGPAVRRRLGKTLLLVHRDFHMHGGSCFATPGDRGPTRAAVALYVAAPMVLELLLALAALPWASARSLGGVLCALFVLTNLLALLRSAWPREVPSMGTSTDGMSLLDLLREPRKELERWRLSGATAEFHMRLLDGETELALQAAERALASDPAREEAAASVAWASHALGRPAAALPHVGPYARFVEACRPREARGLADRALAARGLFTGRELEEYMRASLLVALDRLEEVLAISESGAAAATSEETRALWQACVAVALMMIGRDPDRAEEAARCAYERLPWVPFVETAWGMARIERGDFKEGLMAFDRASGTDADGSGRWLRAAWSAVAGEREGVRALEEPGAWPACRRRVSR